ncbi:MAG: hypothetical protein Q9218_006034 [Villophora microphyllina]
MNANMEQPKGRSFPFLLLARELRDKIYDDLLLSSKSPPSSSEDKTRWNMPSEDDMEVMEYHNRSVYPTEVLKLDTAALQLSCRQVHREVCAAVARLERLKRLSYTLDIMMVDETMIYPTWVSFPVLLRYIPRLDVDVRLLGDVAGKRSGWTPGDGGPPLMVWGLFCLLERFLTRGPDFLSSVKQVTKPKVGELVVNVVSPSPPPPNGFIVEDTRFYRSFRRGERKGLIHPETVLFFMINHMQYLLARSRYTERYATVVFQRIERITFSLDGDKKVSWVLSNLQPDKRPDIG